MTRVESVLSTVEIVAYVSQFVALKKVSGKFFAKCPLHAEKHASFVVFPRTQTFKCFGCGAGRSVIDFARLFFKTDLPGALDILEDKKVVTAPPILMKKEPPVTKISPELERRYTELLSTDFPGYDAEARKIGGFTGAEWKKFGAAWYEGRWILPMRNGRCEIVGLQSRFPDGSKKIWKGSHHGLFIPRCKIPATLYFCEGASDGAALLSLGIVAVARSSALLAINYAIEFAHAHKVERAVIYADNNSAGREGAKQLSEKIGIENKVLEPPTEFTDVRKWIIAGATRTDIEQGIFT